MYKCTSKGESGFVGCEVTTDWGDLGVPLDVHQAGIFVLWGDAQGDVDGGWGEGPRCLWLCDTFGHWIDLHPGQFLVTHPKYGPVAFDADVFHELFEIVTESIEEGL